MRKWAMVALAASMTAAVGCEKNKTTEVTEAPPPPVMEPAPAPPVLTYEPAPAAPAPGAGGSYTVKKGDTLWSIAQRTYGNGQRWQDIVAANPGLDPKKLRVGQTIVLP